MTPTELITACRAKIARVRELRTNGTQGQLTVHHRERVSFIASDTKIADVFATAFGDKVQQESNAELWADRVNSTEADCELVEGLCGLCKVYQAKMEHQGDDWRMRLPLWRDKMTDQELSTMDTTLALEYLLTNWLGKEKEK